MKEGKSLWSAIFMLSSLIMIVSFIVIINSSFSKAIEECDGEAYCIGLNDSDCNIFQQTNQSCYGNTWGVGNGSPDQSLSSPIDQITGCTTISAEGYYTIENDFSFSSNPCIKITVSNVILNGQGYKMTSTSSTVGQWHIYTNVSTTNITIKNIIFDHTGTSDVYKPDFFQFAIRINNSVFQNISVVTNRAFSEAFNVWGTNITWFNISVSKPSISYDRYYCFIGDCDNCSLTNSSIYFNSTGKRPMFYSSWYNSLIKNNNFTQDSGGAIFYYGMDNTTVENNIFNKTQTQSLFIGQDYNVTFRNNYIYAVPNLGLNNFVFIITGEQGWNNSKIYNNYIYANSSQIFGRNTGVKPVYSTAQFNTTKTAGTNIIGGNWIGGNYYKSSTNNGYSQTCFYSKSEGLCINPYNISGTSIFDYLPLAQSTLPTVYLTSPSNNTHRGVQNTTLSCNVSNLYNNITLNVWNSAGTLVYSTFDTSNISTTFSPSTDDNYTWNCFTYDNSDNPAKVWNSTNYTLVIQTSMILFYDGSTIPTGWTCISCNPGDDFYQKFIMGDVTYNLTGGATAHNHTIASFLTSTVTGSYSSSASSGGAGTHNHNVAIINVATASNLPSYRNLKIIKYDNGIPTTLPSGIIGMFNSTSLPTNWNQYTDENNYFIRGESLTNQTGGNNTHSHSVTGIISSGVPTVDYGSESTPTDASNGHTHSFSTTSNNSSSTPPYTTVILAKLNTSSSVPNNLIAMFDGDVDAKLWYAKSNSTTEFFQKFLIANSTYNQTGGSVNHTHANILNFNSLNPSSTRNGGSASGIATSGSHTHKINLTNFNTTSQLPPYISVVIAQRVSSLQVTLNTPQNNYNTTSNSVDFNCTASSSESNISNITLYGNWSGGWHANYTNNTASLNLNEVYLNISRTISDGYYKWNCLAYDINGKSSMASSNFTFFVDNSTPQIQFISPTPNNGQIITSTRTVTINTSHTESYPSKLILSWNGANTTYNYNGSFTNISKADLPNGVYFYYVWVNDTSGHVNSTETRNVTISSLLPLITISSPGTSLGVPSFPATITVDFIVQNGNSCTRNVTKSDGTIIIPTASFNCGDIISFDFTADEIATYTIQIWANNSEGSITSTRYTTIFIETPPPGGGQGGGGGGAGGVITQVQVFALKSPKEIANTSDLTRAILYARMFEIIGESQDEITKDRFLRLKTELAGNKTNPTDDELKLWMGQYGKREIEYVLVTEQDYLNYRLIATPIQQVPFKTLQPRISLPLISLNLFFDDSIKANYKVNANKLIQSCTVTSGPFKCSIPDNATSTAIVSLESHDYNSLFKTYTGHVVFESITKETKDLEIRIQLINLGVSFQINGGTTGIKASFPQNLFITTNQGKIVGIKILIPLIALIVVLMIVFRKQISIIKVKTEKQLGAMLEQKS